MKKGGNFVVIHVVESGETLWLISRRYGVGIDQIVDANQLPNPNQLVVGQALVIPTVDSVHIVRRGENLWGIARRYGVSISDIVAANQLRDPNQLMVGQRLVIPRADQVYVVQPGDTLWQIARRYGTTVEAIARENRITDSLIYPGQRLRIPKPQIEVNGYLTQVDAQGQQIVRDIGEYLTYLTPFRYTIRADGGLNPLNDEGVLAAAREERIAPLIVIANFVQGEFSSELAHAVLANTQVQETLISNILATMRTKGYRGVNFDFEYVLPEDRELYNEFLRRVVARLRPEGFSVSTALAPKISGEQRGLLYAAHDYPAQGQIVDFIVLMTYEWGWAGGPPLAIAPLNEVRRVLDYAVTVIPRDKIVMGMPTYGRDWTLPYVRGGKFAETLSPQEAISRAARYGVSIQYHSLYQSPFFRYVDQQGNEHEVWFEDARSVQAKYAVVKGYRLRGVSYWELTSPFPQNWLVLADNFQVRKFS
jgi:spore germination protein